MREPKPWEGIWAYQKPLRFSAPIPAPTATRPLSWQLAGSLVTKTMVAGFLATNRLLRNFSIAVSMERSRIGLGAREARVGWWRYHLALHHLMYKPASTPTTAHSASHKSSAALMRLRPEEGRCQGVGCGEGCPCMPRPLAGVQPGLVPTDE